MYMDGETVKKKKKGGARNIFEFTYIFDFSNQ